jgi:hypothetical protein
MAIDLRYLVAREKTGAVGWRVGKNAIDQDLLRVLEDQGIESGAIRILTQRDAVPPLPPGEG